MLEVSFTDEMNPARSASVVDVLRQPRLWIPTDQDYGKAYDAWLAKTEAELADNTRYALLGQVGLESVGAIVFRPEPSDQETIGIRNISISPSVGGRYFGAFMLRNAEFIAQQRFPNTQRFEVDTKLTNLDMRQFLQRQGYAEIATSDLYGSSKLDVILEKR